MERDVAKQQAGAFGEQVAPGGTIPLPGTEALRAQQESRRLAALVLMASVCVVGLFVLLRLGPPDSMASQSHSTGGFQPPTPFQGWGTPSLAIVLSGEQFGYLQPCGCSHPQYGGLPRRFNFFQELKNKNWPILAVDLGDLAPPKSGPQLKLKYRYSMMALDKLGYAAVGIGHNELAMPLLDALAEHTLNNPNPRVLSATLMDPGTNAVVKSLIGDSEVVQVKPGAPRVGIFSLVGIDVQDQFKAVPGLGFQPNNVLLAQELAKLKQSKADINILLFQGNPKDPKKMPKDAETIAKYVAEKHLPRLDVILCLSPEEEPPSVPDTIPGIPTQIITVGHKGRYIGVLGVFRKGIKNPTYEFKYQLVSIGPKYETWPLNFQANPLAAMMEEYTKDVKNGDYILKYPTFDHQMQVEFKGAHYVGSDRCAGCHKAAYAKWAAPKGWNGKPPMHAEAFATLVSAQHPSLRQFDGECVQCHVTGFNHPTGYGDGLRTIATDPNRAKMLEGVGCESCHGPGSEHVKLGNTKNQDIHAQMNPWKYTKAQNGAPRQVIPFNIRKIAIDNFCQKCHDIDNDVHWNFEKNWPKIAHPSLNNAVQQPGGVVVPMGAAVPQGGTLVPSGVAPPVVNPYKKAN